MVRIKYPKTKDIIEINKVLLEKIKVKKADKHQTLNHQKIDKIINNCKEEKGDTYDKAVCLIKGITQGHPFASGNRRTAFGVTKHFLEDNKLRIEVENSGKESKTLQGIRENYYKDDEIKEWLKGKGIRKFTR